MAARQAKGKGELAKLVRAHQDLQRQWLTADQRLSAALSRGDTRLAEEQRRELSGLDARFAAIDAQLLKEFPDYAALSNPRPLSIAATQALLSSDEALFLTLATKDGMFAWLVTKNDARWGRLRLTPRAIADNVQALRCGLDHEDEWSDGKRRERCMQLLDVKTAPASEDGLLPFNVKVAHDLHATLFGPFKDLLQDKRLLIVPSGPLASLPFHVLVTDKPEAAIPASFDYRGVAWLGRRHAISVLPSVTSLKLLREHAQPSTATKPYLGFGNPLLTGSDGTDQRAAGRQTCEATSPAMPRAVTARASLRGDTALFRGGLADVAQLRRQPPLPETTDELCAVGRTLAAPSSDIMLGAKATERTVKSLSARGALASYRVLHFATHGLLAGETASFARGLVEPALLLTPPDKASDEDDGLLTASEITQLKLNADWVIMSACNTASGDKLGADALSGLARAFFYAGARALLVSHWYVDSASAVELTTKAFAEMRLDPKLGRAAALQRSMQTLMSGGIRQAHPANWAPFVVVGEGAAR